MQNTQASTVAYTSKNKNFTVVLTNTTVVLTNINVVMFTHVYNTRKQARKMFTVFKANMRNCK